MTLPTVAPNDLTIIDPGMRGWRDEVLEIWQFREVLWALVTRDIKVRYRQSLVGLAWIVIQPLLLAGIATLVFGRLMPSMKLDVPFALFAYLGLWLWGFFAAGLTGAANSLVSHAPLMSKVYVPPALPPLAAIATRVLDLLVGAPVLVGMLALFGVGIRGSALVSVPLIALLVLLCCGVGLLLAAAMVYFRDVGQALPFVLQLGLFASPVLYATDQLPPHVRSWLVLNPLCGILEGVRTSLFGGVYDAPALLIAALWTAVSVIVGAAVFRATERNLIDVI